MKMVKIILGIMGAAYVVIGTGVLIPFLLMPIHTPGASVGIIVPSIFIILGIGFLVGVWMIDRKKRMALKHGTRIPAKIHSYVQDTSMKVNGAYPYNTRVHFWDASGIEREVILTTRFPKGDGKFPIGMTIDIYEYNGYYGYDESSIRTEVLYREAELLDNKPLNQTKLNSVAVICPNCGASFEADAGYVNRCPYCDSYWNI